VALAAAEVDAYNTDGPVTRSHGILTVICRERSKKSLLTWEKVEECAIETGIVDKLEVKFFSLS